MAARIAAAQAVRVAVAMSGGVDSSVAAALLVQQGYRVQGFYLKNFSPESWAGVLDPDCPWQRDVTDAQAVCDRLGIPFASVNFEREYQRQVIEYFFQAYRAGLTPNPDIRCNRQIKFGLFLRYAKRHSFAFIATGHYARIAKGNGRESGVGTRGASYRLLRGLDRAKDQSYFLYQLDQRQLAHTLFPVGAMTKPQVRTLAHKFSLPTADKPDSQGICFIGAVNLRRFLGQRLPQRWGPVVDLAGRTLGEHPGAWYYTIGQREGLGLPGGPFYVVEREVRRNRVVVVRGRRHPALYSRRFSVRRPHWISYRPPRHFPCRVIFRHQQIPQAAVVQTIGQGMTVTFRQPQFAVAEGQSAVCYRGDRVLGGGVISQVERAL